jgi:Ca2+-binding RTX toxin-like protein
MEWATIVGGKKVFLSLDGREVVSGDVQSAINAADAGFSNGAVYTSTADAGAANVFDVYSLDAANVVLPALGDAVILTGSGNDSILGHSGSELLIGNQGADTINAGGGSGEIIAGDGANTISLNSTGEAGGTESILLGTGSDTIELWGGTASIAGIAGGYSLLDVFAGTNLVTATGREVLTIDASGGTNTFNLQNYGGVVAVTGGQNIFNIDAVAGHDAFRFTTTNDPTGTVIDLTGASSPTLRIIGDATVSETAGVSILASAGHLTLTGGGNDVVTAGGGRVTIDAAATSGSLSLFAGAGTDTLIAGSGPCTMEAGVGHDSLVGGSGPTQFEFSAAHDGGQVTVSNFNPAGGDFIHLSGYAEDVNAVLATQDVSNGNDTVHIDATVVEFLGITNLNQSDFG